jgi:hypothetical protein
MDVVDEHRETRHGRARRHPHPPGCAAQPRTGTDLGRRRARRAREHPHHRLTRSPRERTRDRLGLVEAAAPRGAWVSWHRHEHAAQEVIRRPRRDLRGHRLRRREHGPELERGDERARRAVV